MSGFARLVLLLPLLLSSSAFARELVGASFDPAQRFYQDVDVRFRAHWAADHGEWLTVRQALGGSRSLARAVADGLDADIVTFAVPGDVDLLVDREALVDPGWAERFEGQGAPYSTTIVFLVRKGNPMGIHDWSDLVRPGVEVVTSHPKESGLGRWSYLAAWGWAWRNNNANLEGTKSFVAELYRHAPSLERTARGAERQFLERGAGDVLLTWESEALDRAAEPGRGDFEVVVPSASIRVEPAVALVDRNVDARGTRAAAEAWIRFLYTPEAQAIAAHHHYRPRSETLAAEAGEFAPLRLFTVEEAFGGWERAEANHFQAGALIDQLLGG